MTEEGFAEEVKRKSQVVAVSESGLNGQAGGCGLHCEAVTAGAGQQQPDAGPTATATAA